ncbi:MAG: membrane protein insertion efficiency factor YidD [Alicyclobacillaceae bacterium]|nr:membrane protein insertion efficiency factor YidD [Alicyclobacillaceae bacterium]
MAKWIVVFAIRLYQLLISPLTPASCRFVPTCSQYCLEAVSRFGIARGGWLCAKRLAKCGPWHKGGFDPVPSEK